jgi:hypothetical protein
VVLGLAGSLGGAWAIAHERSVRTTLDVQAAGIASLRTLYDAEREAREDSESRSAVAMREQEERCRKDLAARDVKIARLEGQLETVTSSIVGSLVSELRDALVDAVHAAINHPDRRADG